MNFKIWDNHFGGYMRDESGSEARFREKPDADRAIQRFIQSRDRTEEWMFRLDVEHVYGLVETGRRQSPAVRRKDDTGGQVIVVGESKSLVASAKIP